MVVALSNVSSGVLLLAIPLTAILLLKVAENSRLDPEAARSTRALEALAVVLAVGMQWMNLLMPLGLLCLVFVLVRTREEDEATTDPMGDRLLRWMVYLWAGFAIAGEFLLAFETTASL